MTTKEITIYEKNEKTYCESCKPQGGKRGTLVTSSYDHFCAGCGLDLKEIGEAADITQAAYEQAKTEQSILFAHKNMGKYEGEVKSLAELVEEKKAEMQAVSPIICEEGYQRLHRENIILVGTLDLQHEKARLLADIATAQAHITTLLERPMDGRDWQAEQVYSNLANGIARAHSRVAEIDKEETEDGKIKEHRALREGACCRKGSTS